MTAVQVNPDSAVGSCAPVAGETLTEAEAEATAQVFRALSDPARVRILNTLATNGEPVCVCHLVEPLGLTQPTVSHHLKTLAEVGLLEREQKGKWAYFSLKPGVLEQLERLLAF